MNSNGFLHLTVNADGQLALHENPAAALANKKPDEVVVVVSLNAYQIRHIQTAERLAREKRGARG